MTGVAAALIAVAATVSVYTVQLREERDRAALEARLAVEEAQEATAALNVSRTVIAAPFEGRIVDVNVDTGERVAPGQVVARLVDLSHLEVPLQAPVSAASSIRVGDEVSVMADGPSGDTWTGRIARMSPEADPTNRTVTVFVEIQQDPSGSESLLRPGQFVIGTIAAGGAASRLASMQPFLDTGDPRAPSVSITKDSATCGPPRASRVASSFASSWSVIYCCAKVFAIRAARRRSPVVYPISMTFVSQTGDNRSSLRIFAITLSLKSSAASASSGGGGGGVPLGIAA